MTDTCVIVLRYLCMAGIWATVSAGKPAATNNPTIHEAVAARNKTQQYYQLYLTLSDPTWETNGTCGATVLSRYWAVTGAQCCTERDANDTHVPYKPSNLQLHAGSSHFDTGGKWHHVSKVVAHPLYAGFFAGNDVCLLKVAEPFDIGGTVRALSLATHDYPDGTEATFSGWGLTMGNGTRSSTLVNLKTNLVDNSTECYIRYKSDLLKFGEPLAEAYAKFINDKNLCTYKENLACVGDTGSVLTVDDVIVGIVSWSIGCSNKLGVQARVTSFRTWIQDTIRQDEVNTGRT